MSLAEVEALDLAVWPIFSAMSRRGLRVDKARLDSLLEEVQRLKAEALAACQSYGLANPSSGDQVADWTIGKGIQLSRLTRGKMRMSTDEKALLLVKHEHPCIGQILEFRGLQKLETTFLLPIRDDFTGPDGRLHPRWRLTRVVSGRAAASDPNILAMDLRARAAFIASEGMTLLSLDLSQIEPRVTAVLSKDEALLDVYRNGRDLYQETAARLFGISLEDAKTRRYRQPTKVIVLGTLYGIGAPKLKEQLAGEGITDFSVEDCERFLQDLVHRVYPEVGRLIARTAQEMVRSGGWAYTELGRRRFLPGILLEGDYWPQGKLRDEARRQGFNLRIQGTAQEILKRAMLRLEPISTKYNLHWLLQYHDEVVFEGRPEDVEAALPELKAAMEAESAELPIPIVAEVKIAERWSDLK